MEGDGSYYWERLSQRTTWELPTGSTPLWCWRDPDYVHRPSGQRFLELPPPLSRTVCSSAAPPRSAAATWLDAAAMEKPGAAAPAPPDVKEPSQPGRRTRGRGLGPRARSLGTQLSAVDADGTETQRNCPHIEFSHGDGFDDEWSRRVRQVVAAKGLGLALSSLQWVLQEEFQDDNVDDYRPCRKLKDAVLNYVPGIAVLNQNLLFVVEAANPKDFWHCDGAHLVKASDEVKRMLAFQKDGRSEIKKAFESMEWQNWRTRFTWYTGTLNRLEFRCTLVCELPPPEHWNASFASNGLLAGTWEYATSRGSHEFTIVEGEGELAYREETVLGGAACESCGMLRPEGCWWQGPVAAGTPWNCTVRVRRLETAAPRLEVQVKLAEREAGCSPLQQAWSPAVVAQRSARGTYVGYGEGPMMAAVSAMSQALKDPRVLRRGPPAGAVAGEPLVHPRNANEFEALKKAMAILVNMLCDLRQQLVAQAVAEQGAITYRRKDWSGMGEEMQDRACQMERAKELLKGIVADVCRLLSGNDEVPAMPLTDPRWSTARLLSLLWQYILAFAAAEGAVQSIELLDVVDAIQKSLEAERQRQHLDLAVAQVVGMPVAMWEEFAERSTRVASSEPQGLAEEALCRLSRCSTPRSFAYAAHFLPLLFYERAQELRAALSEAEATAVDVGAYPARFTGTWSVASSPQQPVHRADLDLKPLEGGPTLRSPLRRGELALLLPSPPRYGEGVLVELRADFATVSREAGTVLKLKLFAVALPIGHRMERLYRASVFVVQPLRLSGVTHDRQVEAVRAVVLPLARGSGKMDDSIKELVLQSWKQAQPADQEDAALAQGDATPCAGELPTELARGRPEDPEDGAAERISSVPLTPAQRAAVLGSATRRCTLVRGPPGTGKTHTACAIVETWMPRCAPRDSASRLCQGKRVLVVTQSNAAALNIQERLEHFGLPSVRVGMQLRADELLSQRYIQTLCEDQEIENLRRAAAASDDGEARVLMQPMLQRASKRAPIVVMTCISSGNMSLLGQCNFARVLLDEAAQATEPTSLVPLLTGATAFACVGDDKQLPATVVSRQAQVGGLSESLFERLIRARVVDVGDGFVQLDVQRRMHSSIAAFPSQIFYGGSIENGCRDEDRPTVPGLHWPQGGLCRVLFVCGHGTVETPCGTSFQNSGEAEMLTETLARLLMVSDEKGDAVNVAAITGYAAQKELLKRQISRMPTGAVRVDTVDGFQGMERDLVLVSTVRANASGDVGFLRDARRANVLLTRARRGLIVFGHYETLECEAQVWRPWLRWATEQGAVVTAAELRDRLLWR